MDFEQEIEKAKRRIAMMDKIDGWKPRDPGTIAAALECGLMRPETGAQYDALVMLQEVAQMKRGRQ